jgi:hypothetical protein
MIGSELSSSSDKSRQRERDTFTIVFIKFSSDEWDGIGLFELYAEGSQDAHKCQRESLDCENPSRKVSDLSLRSLRDSLCVLCVEKYLTAKSTKEKDAKARKE